MSRTSDLLPFMEVINDLSNQLRDALLDRGESESHLEDLKRKRNEYRRKAFFAWPFSEKRYNLRSKYYAYKAEIVREKKIIDANERRIAELEYRIASHGVPAPANRPKDPVDKPKDPVDTDIDANPDMAFFEES